MTLASALLVLTLIWVAIYALNHLLKPSRNKPVLPSTRHSQRSSWTESTTTVSLKGLHLRVQTTTWNLSHDLLAASINNGRKTNLCRVIKRFYDAGTVVSLIGMVVAFGFLLTMSGMSAVSLALKLGESYRAEAPVRLTKRSLDALSGSSAPSTNSSFIRPIIPGVTVPFAHLPVILVTVFLAQIVHELGHAISAAIESLPILSVGASFTLIVPSAFVTFSSTGLDSLRPLARARVIAAGPFHNLLLWVLLISMEYACLGEIFWSVGYHDVSALGKVVTFVDQQSPLHGYLPLGSVITRLDDTPLGSQNASYDGWSTYLNQDRHDQVLGWCATLPDNNDTCCTGTKISGLSCFVSMDFPTTRGCLNPLPILGRVNTVKRCMTDDECSTKSRCIKPGMDEQLLRLTVQQPSEQGLEVILWSGPAEEILEEVEVGTLKPRISLLPISLPYFAMIFREYLVMATLSLFFFNLLPLPYLDGSKFLNTVCEASLDSPASQYPDDDDLEDERRLPRRRIWLTRVLASVPEFTIGLLVVCTLLGALHVYWH